MENTTSVELHEETAVWCRRAEAFAERDEGESTGIFPCLDLVREGIFLRRRWDRTDRDAVQRRELLGLLAAAQNLCQRRLAEGVSGPDPTESTKPDPRRIEHMLRRLTEDDRYLAELLDDQTLSTEATAFAVACFRDDLHWLGTLVALLDGNRGIDFTGRVLLEQESIQRTLEASDDGMTVAADEPTSDPLYQAARRLRTTALTRQAESLLGQPTPDDWEGWYRTWQSASGLARRPKGIMAAELEQAVQTHRSNASDRWADCLEALPETQRLEALHRVSDELADAAGEALTFLEDLPMVEAVRTLEVLAEDADTCLHFVKKYERGGRNGLRRALQSRRKAVATELMERRLTWRMERIFGPAAVAFLERSILILLLLFVVMLAVEIPLANYAASFGARATVIGVCAWLDLGICMVFLSEFCLKFYLAQPRRRYFERNWITGLIPAIPFGFMAYAANNLAVAEAAEGIVLLRALRFLRFGQMARWLRLMRPVLRGARLVAFAMQASDRLVRRVAPLINRNLVLFEQAAIEIPQPPYRTKLALLRERCQYRAAEVATGLSPPQSQRLIQARIEDLTAILSGPKVGLVSPTAATDDSTTREIPLEKIISRLLAATPAGISDRIGRNLAWSVARWCRAFDVIGIRRLPLIRDLVEAGRRESPYGATAHVANRIGTLLKQTLDRIYWVADFYGTLTAPQLVDSVGGWMIRRTARPARRLLMFGIAFLVITSLAGLIPSDVLQGLSRTVRRWFAAPLVILGILCLVPLVVGMWFRQIAGEASSFFSRVAEAQFITATKRLKRRLAKQHFAILRRRVIQPEMKVAQASSAGGDRNGDDVIGDIDLLFRDYLDGAPFHRSDTKTTTQLLGNLTLISLRETRLHYSRRRRKHLKRLDLDNTRVWLQGPYLWFHFISRSLSQQTAKLVVDYNAHALPRDRAAGAGDAEIRRYVGWLCERLRVPPDRLQLPGEFRDRIAALADGPDEGPETKHDRRRYGFHGNEFTAIHFLSADPELETRVRRRFGRQVAELLRRDRIHNVRRAFRTYPFHRWPKQQRTFNPLAMHARYFSSGKVLLLPLRLLSAMVMLIWRGLRLLGTFVRDVLDPTVGELKATDESDPFAVAVRKIHRMRKPVFLECLRMRAEFDPEYLGAVILGTPGLGRKTMSSPVEEDLNHVGADPGTKQEFRNLAAQRRRQVRRFGRLLKRLGMETYSPQSIRAMAVAYTIDYHQIRSRLEATRLLQRAFGETVEQLKKEPGTVPYFYGSLRAVLRAWRYRRKMDRLFARPRFEHYDMGQQQTLRRLICRRGEPLLRALRTLSGRDVPPDPEQHAREILTAVANDPATWSRQLVVLRAVQTLSVLDLRTYCSLVHELGEYEDELTQTESVAP